MIRHQSKPNWLPILSGLLLGLSFADARLAWLGLIGLIPYLFWLERQTDRGRIIKGSWLMGFTMMAAVMVWLLQVTGNDWLPLTPLTARGLAIAGWLLAALVFSAGFLIVGWVVSRNLDRPRWQQALILGAAWVAGEWARAWLFSVLVAGVGATIGPHWHFGVLGFLATDLGLGIIGRTIGFYGLSALVVGLNYAAFRAIKDRSAKPIGLAAAALLVGLALSTLPYRSSRGQIIRVAAVQINDQANPNFFADLRRLTPTAAPKDLVVLPEHSNFFYQGLIPEDRGQTRAELLNYWLGDRGGAALTSRKIASAPGQPDYNQLALFNRDEQLLDSQNKWFLIPAGEYVPFVYLPFLERFQRQTLSAFADQRAIAKSPTRERPLVTGDLRLGSLACSGVMSPELYRRLARQGVGLMTNSAALEYFNQSRFFNHQTAQIIRFDAAANAKPFIQATSSGRSYIFDRSGQPLQSTALSKRPAEVIESEIKTSPGQTFYSRYGEVVLWASLLGLAGLSLTKLKPLRFNKHKH